MPKRSLSPITNSDFYGRVENIHIFLGARIAGAHPNLVGIFSFKPRPSQTKIQGEFLQMQHTQATKLFGATNGLPIDLVFGTGGRILCRPKKVISTLLMYFKVSGTTFSSVE
jgi:hypothetical protein